MSLHVLAKQMAAKGRGPDTHLVHMASSELAGLQALARAHGGSLTTNPETGLPEAGFLSAILPTVLGAGLTFMSGGALSPLMAAGLVGGGTALATGSLSRGLTAGLGAYGGAGLMGGLAGLGEAAGTAAASGAASNVGGEAASQFLASPAAQGLAPEYAQQLASQTAQDVADQVGLQGGVASPAFDAAAKAATPGTWEALKAGASRITDPGGMQAYLDQLGGTTGALKYGLSALAPALAQSPEGGVAAPTSPAQRYRYDPNRVADPEAGYTGAATGERRYFDPRFVALAEGGLPALATKDDAPKNPPPEKKEPTDIFTRTLRKREKDAGLAGGGLAGLAEGGRFLQGAGDGVSDSIPASIDGQQPAQLANEEYVIPARIVSELGNGSSSAGAKRLDQMVARVQARAAKATRGRFAVAKDTQAYKALPA